MSLQYISEKENEFFGKLYELFREYGVGYVSGSHGDNAFLKFDDSEFGDFFKFQYASNWATSNDSCQTGLSFSKTLERSFICDENEIDYSKYEVT